MTLLYLIFVNEWPTRGVYFLKIILNFTPAPSYEVLTISPFAMMVFLASGKLIFIAISCLTNKGSVVLIKTPLELTF